MKKLLIVATALISANLATSVDSVQAAPAAMTIAVVGDVKKPGIYKLSATTKLMDAIVSAGGMTARPDAVRIIMWRNKTGESSTKVPQSALDLLQPLQKKPAELSIQASQLLNSKEQQNLQLQDGDFIFIQRQQATASVATAKPQQKDSSERSQESFQFNGRTIYVVPLRSRKSK